MALLETFTAGRVLAVTLAVVALLLLAVGTFSSVKRVSPVGWGWYGVVHAPDGIAIDGYDAVSYRDGAAAQGVAAHAVHHGGAEWRFVSEEHRAAFEADPGRYAPQYGGFCAFAVSKGFTAATDPEAFALHDDELYLFADQGVRTSWLAETQESLARSEANWQRRCTSP